MGVSVGLFNTGRTPLSDFPDRSFCLEAEGAFLAEFFSFSRLDILGVKTTSFKGTLTRVPCGRQYRRRVGRGGERIFTEPQQFFGMRAGLRSRVPLPKMESIRKEPGSMMRSRRDYRSIR